MIFDHYGREYADFFWQPKLGEDPQPLMVDDRSIWWVPNDPFQGEETVSMADWYAYRDYIHAIAFLSRQHTFLISTRCASAVYRYYANTETPRRIARFVVDLLVRYALPKPKEFAPILMAADGDRRLTVDEVDELIGKLVKLKSFGLELPNLLIGAEVNEPKHLARLGTLTTIGNLRGRFIHIYSSLSIRFEELVWSKQNRSLDWVLVDRCQREVIVDAVRQCVNTGTPVFVTDYSRVPWDCALQAYPDVVHRAPLVEPELVRAERARQRPAL